MHYTFPQDVLFRHCDPAGIVFFPRYFEMLNDAVEALFRDLLKWPFEEVHKSGGVPTVALNVEFSAPSRHGDRLDLEITIRSVGGASLALETVAVGSGVARFTARHTLVLTNAAGRPRRWPGAVREKLTRLIEGAP